MPCFAGFHSLIVSTLHLLRRCEHPSLVTVTGDEPQVFDEGVTFIVRNELGRVNDSTGDDVTSGCRVAVYHPGDISTQLIG